MPVVSAHFRSLLCTGRCRKQQERDNGTASTTCLPRTSTALSQPPPPPTHRTSRPPGVLRWIAGATGAVLVAVLLIVHIAVTGRQRTSTQHPQQRVVEAGISCGNVRCRCVRVGPMPRSLVSRCELDNCYINVIRI